jgi:hypothetical protein
MPFEHVAGGQGPAIRALNPWLPGNPKHQRAHQLLSDQDRPRLAVISSVVRFRRRAEIYRKGDDAVFNIISGAVKAYTQGPGTTSWSLHFYFRKTYLASRKKVVT